MKNLTLVGGGLKSSLLPLIDRNVYARGAFLTDGTPIVVLNDGDVKSISHDGWLVEFLGGDNYADHSVHPLEQSGHPYSYPICGRVRKLTAAEMSCAAQYFTGVAAKVKFTVINPSTKMAAALAAWKVDSGFTQTCHRDTCSHASHDAGYDWEAYEVPQAVAEYLDAGDRIRQTDGNVHCHQSHDWQIVRTERSLRNRGEHAAADCLDVVNALQKAVELIDQLHLGDNGATSRVVNELAELACSEIVNNVTAPKAYFALENIRIKLQNKLTEQKTADRRKESDAFIGSAQWNGLSAGSSKG